MIRFRRPLMLGLILLALCLGLSATSWAGLSGGDPSSTALGNNIPMNGSVSPYVIITYESHTCAFAPLNGPNATSACTTPTSVQSNAAVIVQFTVTRLQNSTAPTVFLTSNYTVSQAGGTTSPSISADPGTPANSTSFLQGATGLNTAVSYTVNGNAAVDMNNTLSGLYTGNIAITVLSQ